MSNDSKPQSKQTDSEYITAKGTKFRKVNANSLRTPQGGFCQVIKAAWWVVTEDSCVLLYPVGRTYTVQCNQDRSIARSMQRKMFPDCMIMQLPIVCLPINPSSDYRIILPKK